MGYFLLVAQTFEARITARVVGEVRRLRDEQNMSAQALSDRLTQIGHPMSRSVIAALESGRRDYLTIGDIAALAVALSTSPIALIWPAPYQQADELVPGVEDTRMGAIRWWCAEAGFEDDTRLADPKVYAKNLHPLRVMRQLDGLQNMHASTRALIAGAEAAGDTATVAELQKMLVAQAANIAALQRDVR